MKLTLNQALAVLRPQGGVVSRCEIFLVCGFQPLHLATFLKAYFAVRFPGRAADVLEGLYGDLDGALASAAKSNATAAAVVMEWGDLDSRLSLRSAGGWGLSVEQDILANCAGRWAAILGRIKDLASTMPVALVLPTLPIPLFGHTAGWQMGVTEAELHKQAAAFLADAARVGNVTVLHPSRLAGLSPEPTRRDPKMELSAGFPYSIEHASAVASLVVELLFPAAPMKGLITDLDETLWSGVVGEVGVSGVSWSLAEHAQVHGLYQQTLRYLSELGVLLAVASKNESAVVEAALRRDDLLVASSSFFPVCANWGPKSGSVAEILRTWNIGAESVVFVDDSAMEIDEVRTAFPAMTCLQFLKKPAQAVDLLVHLRDLFGKPAVYPEDALRQAGIRANVAVQAAAGSSSASGEFVRGLQGRLTFDCRKDTSNKRLLELINKTNQFNLNGVRLSEGEWMRHLADPASIVVGVSYEDKFGPLGVVGVMAGKRAGRRLMISTWVMSCRAFSRKIESHTLDYLLSLGEGNDVVFDFRPTERNSPMRDFVHDAGLTANQQGEWVLSREAFDRMRHELPHQVLAPRDESPVANGLGLG